MRKSTLLLATGLVGISSWALAMESDVIELPANFDAWNLNFKIPIQELPTPEVKIESVAKAGNMMKNVRKAADPTNYFVAAQRFHEGYTFNFEGGDIDAYNIGIAIDGNKVTISNFFNLEAQSTDWSVGVDYDVVGTYDADAKTITIPTSSDFNEATIAGTIAGYYTEVVIAGTVNENGQMAPEDKLVFNVIGDFEALETDQNFGIMNYSKDGSYAFGFQQIYRKFYATLPGKEPKLVNFNPESNNMGDAYPGMSLEKSFVIVNVSGVDVDYVVEMDSDDDTFTVTPDGGSIPATSMQNFTVSFASNKSGEFEGLVNIEYDGEEETPEPIVLHYDANVVPIPDYSAIVNEGEFSFMTTVDFPFEMTELEDGTRVARSSLNGEKGTSSLTVDFEVAEGHIGVFSWKGACGITEWTNVCGYYIDNSSDAAAIFQATSDISNSMEFGPGKHSVRFQHEAMRYNGNANNELYVYDLSLSTTAADADAVVVETPVIKLPNTLLKGENGGVSSQGAIVLRNRGANPLSVLSVASTDNHFVASVPSDKVTLLETIEVPVVFNADEAGEYASVLTISTSAGDIEATIKTKVRVMADFSEFVVEGAEFITAYSTDEENPFTIENGVAYNANSGDEDDVAATSWFQLDITIPEGKVGYPTWDGVLYGDCPDEGQYWLGDYSGVYFYHPMTMGELPTYPNETDASSNHFENDNSWSSMPACISGNHYIRFKHYKNGDGRISEKDRVEYSNFRLRVEDLNEKAVEADKTEIVFEKPIYVGGNRYLEEYLYLKNVGSQPMEVLDCESEGCFLGLMPGSSYPVQWNNQVMVGVIFYPDHDGDHDGSVTFKTTSGDVVVKCHGTTISSEGILMNGDVEDMGYGWSYYDADGDGLCWNLGSSMWGVVPEYCHEGENCFGSPSYDPWAGGIEPDHWLFSPEFTVPEDGAILRWYAGAHDYQRYAEHYSVYVAMPQVVENTEDLEYLDPLFSETLEGESVDNWQERTLDLTEFAGEDVVIAFRHHDCFGQYVLRLDDIFVYDMQKWNGMNSGVDKVETASDVVSTEIYDISGLRLNTLKPGVNIVRRTHADGSVKTSKIVVK